MIRRIAALESAACCVSAVLARPAWAHAAHQYTSALAAWQFTPEITLGLMLFAGLYVSGMRRRSHSCARDLCQRWRTHAFFAGLASIYVALQSPLDFLSDHLFFVHQIQHLMLMMLAPILLMLSAPEATLIAGLPRSMRHHVLAPIVANGMVRAIFGSLTHPVAATLFVGGTLYFWMIPRIYDAALLHEGIHYLMHISMLFGGLLFWWRVLDRRRPPAGAPYLLRAAMLKVNFMMLALLAAYFASKDSALYRGDGGVELLGMTTLVDERLGGMVLWLPGCAILVAAIFLTVHWWIQEAQEPSHAAPRDSHGAARTEIDALPKTLFARWLRSS